MTCLDCIHYEVCNRGHKALGYPTTDKFGFAEYCVNYEDKALYIKLPCKVGAEVFEITIDYKRVCSFRILSLSQLARLVEDNVFGEWLFLSREEAEKALAERKENEN